MGIERLPGPSSTLAEPAFERPGSWHIGPRRNVALTAEGCGPQDPIPAYPPTDCARRTNRAIEASHSAAVGLRIPARAGIDKHLRCPAQENESVQIVRAHLLTIFRQLSAPPARAAMTTGYSPSRSDATIRPDLPGMPAR